MAAETLPEVMSRKRQPDQARKPPSAAVTSSVTPLRQDAGPRGSRSGRAVSRTCQPSCTPSARPPSTDQLNSSTASSSDQLGVSPKT